MIPKEYQTLVNKLKSATENYSHSWVTTSDSEKFMMRIGLNAVSIRQYEYYDEDGEYMGDVVGLEIINEKGDVIDGFSTYWTDSSFQEMLDLFKMARRNALKIDKTISQMISDLDMPY